MNDEVNNNFSKHMILSLFLAVDQTVEITNFYTTLWK